jgi:hypothetical protein
MADAKEGGEVKTPNGKRAAADGVEGHPESASAAKRAKTEGTCVSVCMCVRLCVCACVCMLRDNVFTGRSQQVCACVTASMSLWVMSEHAGLCASFMVLLWVITSIAQKASRRHKCGKADDDGHTSVYKSVCAEHEAPLLSCISSRNPPHFECHSFMCLPETRSCQNMQPRPARRTALPQPPPASPCCTHAASLRSTAPFLHLITQPSSL